MSYEIKKNGKKNVGVKLHFSNKNRNYDSDYLKLDFNLFKKNVIEKYKGKFIIQGVNGYDINTKFYLSEEGYIVNGANNKPLNASVAYSVWNLFTKIKNY